MTTKLDDLTDEQKENLPSVLRELFAQADRVVKIAAMTDAQLVKDVLEKWWGEESIFSAAGDVLASVIERLLRANGGPEPETVWTRKMPTEPGLYWACTNKPHFDIAGPQRIALNLQGKPFHVECFKNDGKYEGSEWGGYWWPVRIADPPKPGPMTIEDEK